jgi:serine/threonine protein kinase
MVDASAYRQICAAIESMHKAQPAYAHWDLKPANILLSYELPACPSMERLEVGVLSGMVSGLVNCSVDWSVCWRIGQWIGGKLSGLLSGLVGGLLSGLVIG